YRLMAEWATDAVCRKLAVTAACTTADKPLPGSEPEDQYKEVKLPQFAGANLGMKASVGRQGSMTEKIDYTSEENREL
ncbi:anaerobic glycerol-3-phosphate dehydrogenase subunit A, partial [Salmonella enterica]